MGESVAIHHHGSRDAGVCLKVHLDWKRVHHAVTVLDAVLHAANQPEPLVTIKVSKVSSPVPNFTIGLKNFVSRLAAGLSMYPGFTSWPRDTDLTNFARSYAIGTKAIFIYIWQLFGQVDELHGCTLGQLPGHITVALDGHRVLHGGMGHGLSFSRAIDDL